MDSGCHCCSAPTSIGSRVRGKLVSCPQTSNGRWRALKTENKNWLLKGERSFHPICCHRLQFGSLPPLFFLSAAPRGSFGGFCESKAMRTGPRQLFLRCLVRPVYFYWGFRAGAGFGSFRKITISPG